jgi:hypothetical protein
MFAAGGTDEAFGPPKAFQISGTGFVVREHFHKFAVN